MNRFLQILIVSWCVRDQFAVQINPIGTTSCAGQSHAHAQLSEVSGAEQKFRDTVVLKYCNLCLFFSIYKKLCKTCFAE